MRRRDFLHLGLGAAAMLAHPRRASAEAPAAERPTGGAGIARVGVLVDTTLCIGCRECEAACNRANGLPRPARPFSDRGVLAEPRRMSPDAFTVVNAFTGPPAPGLAGARTFVKHQCMHCLDPACVSACLVGALHVADDGAVVYDPRRCMGCRYCMVACPFGVPSFEYHRALAPRVRKCELCANLAGAPGARPACAAACPVEALVFGERSALIALARARIHGRPGRYRERIYGEREVGGTSWLYLAGRPFAELGLPELPAEAPPRLTESIQRGIFRFAALPVALYAALSGLWWLNGRRRGTGQVGEE